MGNYIDNRVITSWTSPRSEIRNTNGSFLVVTLYSIAMTVEEPCVLEMARDYETTYVLLLGHIVIITNKLNTRTPSETASDE